MAMIHGVCGDEMAYCTACCQWYCDRCSLATHGEDCTPEMQARIRGDAPDSGHPDKEASMSTRDDHNPTSKDMLDAMLRGEG